MTMTDKKCGGLRATYDDVLNAPETKVAELIDGVLYLSPISECLVNFTTTALIGDVGGPFMKNRGGPGGWWFLYRTELHFGEDVLVPDIAGWRHSRMPRVPDVPFFTLAPDWLCETLSPTTEKLDRAKLGIYANERVPHAWLVDPGRKTLEVLALRESSLVTQATYRGHDRARAEPFDAIEIELAFLWGEEPESSKPTGA
jgi:Uma2 family endonuclease